VFMQSKASIAFYLWNLGTTNLNPGLGMDAFPHFSALCCSFWAKGSFRPRPPEWQIRRPKQWKMMKRCYTKNVIVNTSTVIIEDTVTKYMKSQVLIRTERIYITDTPFSQRTSYVNWSYFIWYQINCRIFFVDFTSALRAGIAQSV
jgi:hypothetical protein